VVPAHAVVDATVVGDELVGDPVLVLKTLGIFLHSLLPDLKENVSKGSRPSRERDLLGPARLPCSRAGSKSWLSG
jgi:hypothetical protein